MTAQHIYHSLQICLELKTYFFRRPHLKSLKPTELDLDSENRQGVIIAIARYERKYKK